MEATQPSIAIEITGHTQHGNGVGTYITYEIATQSAAFSEASCVVNRRYREFAWLRELLCEKYPGCFVPTLPGKANLLSVGNVVGYIDPVGVEVRKRALQCWLRRLVRHYRLRKCPELQIFLAEKKDDKFAEAQSKAPLKSSATSAFSYVYSFFTSSKAAFVSDTETEKERTYLKDLHEKLVSVRNYTEFISNKRRDCGGALKELALAMGSIAVVDEEKNGACNPYFRHYQESGVAVSSHLEKHAQEESDTFLTQIDDYLSVVNGALEAYTMRETQLMEKASLEQDLEKKKANAPKGTYEQDASKTKTRIDEIRSRTQQMLSVLSAEYEYFNTEIRRDFAKLLQGNITMQLEYGTKIQSAWQACLAKYPADEIAPEAASVRRLGSGGAAAIGGSTATSSAAATFTIRVD